jgi:hypothetical protein
MDASAETLFTRVISALDNSIQDVRIGSDERAYVIIPDLLAFKNRMENVERELHVDIHCIVARHQAQLSVTPRA